MNEAIYLKLKKQIEINLPKKESEVLLSVVIQSVKPKNEAEKIYKTDMAETVIGAEYINRARQDFNLIEVKPDEVSKLLGRDNIKDYKISRK